jgi:hypothetical protein
MKHDEAIEQIAYLKELISNAKWKAAECYPLFILWGVVYIPGYIINNFTLWIILGVIGIILNAVFFLTIYKHSNNGSWLTLPLLKQIAMLAMVVFISGTLFFIVLMKNRAWPEVNAFWPFYSGTMMMILGISFSGLFPVITGLWLALVSVISVFIPMPYQSIWLAITTGGGAVFAGLLLRHMFKKAKKKANN